MGSLVYEVGSILYKLEVTVRSEYYRIKSSKVPGSFIQALIRIRNLDVMYFLRVAKLSARSKYEQ